MFKVYLGIRLGALWGLTGPQSFGPRGFKVDLGCGVEDVTLAKGLGFRVLGFRV